jgi:hypothetical protein
MATRQAARQTSHATVMTDGSIAAKKPSINFIVIVLLQLSQTSRGGPTDRRHRRLHSAHPASRATKNKKAKPRRPATTRIWMLSNAR